MGSKVSSRRSGSPWWGDYPVFSQELLRYANRGTARIEFLAEVSRILLRFVDCDALAIEVRDPELEYRWTFAQKPQPLAQYRVIGPVPGLLATNDAAHYPSNAFFEFTCDERTSGILQAKSLQPGYFDHHKSDQIALMAQTLGLAIANRKAQWALRERVKELTCLYGIGRIAQRGDALPQALGQIADLLPPAWQFPEIARARIVLDGAEYATPGFVEGLHRQSAAIVTNGEIRGRVEVAYPEPRDEFAEGPFLKEEYSLLETVARELGVIVEGREAEEYRARVQTQLRHADRLATIGQLAAGVAHELNEPLGSILGFAQLAQKHPGLPVGPANDLQRIVKACLHARDVIRKLLLFARQKTPLKAEVNLNRIVEEGLYFLESRCVKAGISVVRELMRDLPEVQADASQLHQVLVNLVVNGLQAMPQGGSVTIQTGCEPDCVFLAVSDTGSGMSEEVQAKIFAPFFTTKDVDQGTGLGLAVVHGIVSSHGGSIRVESTPGKGSRFEIRLPRDPASPGRACD